MVGTSSGVSGCALQLPKTQCGRSLGQVTNLQYIALLFTKAPCQPLLSAHTHTHTHREREKGGDAHHDSISCCLSISVCLPVTALVSIQSVKDFQSKYCPPCRCTLAAGEVVSSILLILPPDGVWPGTKCCQSPPDTPSRFVGCTLAEQNNAIHQHTGGVLGWKESHVTTHLWSPVDQRHTCSSRRKTAPAAAHPYPPHHWQPVPSHRCPHPCISSSRTTQCCRTRHGPPHGRGSLILAASRLHGGWPWRLSGSWGGRTDGYRN